MQSHLISFFCRKVRDVWRVRLAVVCALFASLMLLGSPQIVLAADGQDPYAPETYPTVNYGSGKKAEQIQHGEYLSKAGDCIACHTAVGGKPFSGGLPIKTPFGTIYSPNITPDPETGIGKWSDAQFDRAMREGIGIHGEYYYPVFPYPFFNKLSRQDVLDIKAYLDALPPVRQSNRDPDMPWPFRERILQSFWRFMFFDFHKGQFAYDNRKSPEWNRGAYLVQGLGHCAMCHTKVNALGGWETQYNLAGGFVDNYYAPNISASGLKNVPTQKVLNVFLRDQLIKGGMVQGPMYQVNHDSLIYLSHQDLSAIVTYLRTVESQSPPAPSQGSGEKAGKAIYNQYCAGCHANGGGGAPKFGDSAQWSPLVKQGLNSLYENAIKGIGGMPPKGTCDTCTDEQIRFTVDYMISNSTGGSAKSTASSVPSGSALTSLARGKQVYDQVCSVCHNQGQLGAPVLGNKMTWTPIMKQNFDVVVQHTLQGYKAHPPRGACYGCSDTDIISAVKYMAQQSGTGDYTLW